MKNGNGEYSTKFALLNSVSRVLTGQWVARTPKTLHERAFEAADLVNGVSLLVQPTTVQSATLWRVNRAYVSAALARQKERELILSGAVPLVPPPVKALSAPVGPQERLAEVVAELGVNGTLSALAAIERGAVSC